MAIPTTTIANNSASAGSSSSSSSAAFAAQPASLPAQPQTGAPLNKSAQHAGIKYEHSSSAQSSATPSSRSMSSVEAAIAHVIAMQKASSQSASPTQRLALSMPFIAPSTTPSFLSGSFLLATLTRLSKVDKKYEAIRRKLLEPSNAAKKLSLADQSAINEWNAYHKGNLRQYLTTARDSDLRIAGDVETRAFPNAFETRMYKIATYNYRYGNCYLHPSIWPNYHQTTLDQIRDHCKTSSSVTLPSTQHDIDPSFYNFSDMIHILIAVSVTVFDAVKENTPFPLPEPATSTSDSSAADEADLLHREYLRRGGSWKELGFDNTASKKLIDYFRRMYAWEKRFLSSAPQMRAPIYKTFSWLEWLTEIRAIESEQLQVELASSSSSSSSAASAASPAPNHPAHAGSSGLLTSFSSLANSSSTQLQTGTNTQGKKDSAAPPVLSSSAAASAAAAAPNLMDYYS